ncbi:Cellular tumor antigen p53, putative [Gryllus bimaculatus]|nr:Cellular tumor antigen p53, putative [Gryllus bimaculatus]
MSYLGVSCSVSNSYEHPGFFHFLLSRVRRAHCEQVGASFNLSTVALAPPLPDVTRRGAARQSQAGRRSVVSVDSRSWGWIYSLGLDGRWRSLVRASEPHVFEWKVVIMNSQAEEAAIVSEGVLERSIYEFGTSDVDMFLKSEQHYGVGHCLHQDATFCVGSSQEITNTVLFENLPDSTQQNIVMPVISPVSTSTHPSMVNYPGPYSFDVQLNKSAGDKTKWEHSSKLNKLFVVMDAKIPLWFKVKPVEPGLLVRILPIFLAQDYFAEPVKRCPTHISSLEKSNQDFFYVDHIVRCHHQGVKYQKDPDSQRLSVIVPIEPPQPGSDWFTIMCSFMCKNSCILGMNRRSTALIFTLERETGEVIGRKLLNVRICSCPRRDMSKEESDQSKKKIEPEKEIMKMKSCDKKILMKKPTKLSNELVKLPIPRKFLKPLKEIILLHKHYRDLTEEEKIFLEDINKHLL